MAFNYEFPYTDPNMYNDDWLLHTVKNIVAQLGELEYWKEEFKEAYEEIMEIYNQIISGDFPDSVKEAFYKWMQENAVNIVGSMVKNVFFGLTDDGYFVAYIPDSWEDIEFNTSEYDIILSDHPEYGYGHLVLSY